MSPDAQRDLDPRDPYLSIADLAAAYQSGALRPSAVVAAHLDRIARYDPKIGAYQAVYADDAMAAAEAADKAIASGHRIGPFHGIPFALKDICEFAGRVTTWGSEALNDRVSTETGTVARRLVAAGGVVLGKTKTVEFAFGGWGTNQRMGTPWNPWDLETHRAPGGSSSGSAAATASGMAVCAVGTDTGGSVRVPAGFCGLAGLKTTAGWLPLDGIMPLSATLDTPGPLARSALDALLMTEVMAGREGWAMEQDWSAGRGVYGALAKGVDGLRLAVIDDATRERCASDMLARYDAAIAALCGLGAVVEPFSPPRPIAEMADACGAIIAAECYANHRAIMEDRAAPLDEDVRARTLAARDLSSAAYQAMLAARHADTAAFDAAFARFDAFLTPATPAVAAPVSTIDQSTSPGRFTRPFNYLSMCGFTTPTGVNDDGAPTGLQIAARGGAEGMALRIGAALERALPPLSRPDFR